MPEAKHSAEISGKSDPSPKLGKGRAAPLGKNCPNGSKRGKIELEGLSGKKGTILSNYLQ